MLEQFIKDIYDEVVISNNEIYKNIYNNSNKEDVSGDEYYGRALTLYEHISAEEKEILFEIIKQTSIDVLSNIFGIIDGSSSMKDMFDYKFSINDEEVAGELQDAFLEFVENQEM